MSTHGMPAGSASPVDADNVRSSYLDSVQIFPESAYGVYVWAIYEFALAYDGTGIEH